MNTTDLATTKFVWAYMITEGSLASGEWNYYRGEFDYPTYASDRVQQLQQYDKFKADVKLIGVDWDKTSLPVSSLHRAFIDTDSPSDVVETLLGTIVLLDGSTYTVGVSNAEKRFADYVSAVTECMNNKHYTDNIFGNTHAN